MPSGKEHQLAAASIILKSIGGDGFALAAVHLSIGPVSALQDAVANKVTRASAARGAAACSWRHPFRDPIVRIGF